MKKLALTVICMLCFGFAQAQYDNWAVGFKLGEPTGINIRKYFNNINAFDITIGTYGGIIANDRDYRRGKYKNTGLSVQAHYLWHTPLFNSEAVHVYYGLGAQFNSRNYYPDNKQNLPSPGDRERPISIGASALGGFEYFIPDNRISVFLEGGLYSELLPRPLYLSPNISGGVRFNL
jgi:hypothetical protein